MVLCACNPSYLRGGGKRITWTLEAEVEVGRDYTTVLQPGNRAWLRLQKKKKLNLSQNVILKYKLHKLDQYFFQIPSYWEEWKRQGRFIQPCI